jgi:hypothetical protein
MRFRVFMHERFPEILQERYCGGIVAGELRFFVETNFKKFHLP